MEVFKKLSLKGFLSKPKTHKPSFHSQPKEIIVVLSYSRHCRHCSLEVKRSCEKMKGVVKAELDDENSQVTVEGAFDVEKLVKHIRRRNDKIVTIVEKRSVGEKEEDDADADDRDSVFTSHYSGYGSSEEDDETFRRH